MQASLKVLVVDDSAFYRHRIGEMLEAAPDLEIAGYATNGEEAVKLAQQLHPDVITMDVQMPVLDG
ncbi:response regulator, partial [endosymbiont of Lamellibrachia barhami]